MSNPVEEVFLERLQELASAIGESGSATRRNTRATLKLILQVQAICERMGIDANSLDREDDISVEQDAQRRVTGQMPTITGQHAILSSPAQPANPLALGSDGMTVSYAELGRIAKVGWGIIWKVLVLAGSAVGGAIGERFFGRR